MINESASSFGGAVFTDTDLRQIISTEEAWTEMLKLHIYPFSEESLTPVGYDLRVGYRCTSTIRGETIELKPGDKIKILPGDTCLITTLETVDMPKDRSLSGLIVSSVTMVSKGLSHVSTSIDPDWYGQLMIVMHNHASSSVELEVGNRLCTVVFLGNRSASTKSCGTFPGRDDIYRKRLLDATRKRRRRDDLWIWLPVSVIPLSIGLGYTFFGNNPGMAAVSTAGVGLYSMLHALMLSKMKKRDE